MRRLLTVLGGALALLAGTTPAAHATAATGHQADIAAAGRMLDMIAGATDPLDEAIELALLASERQMAALGARPAGAAVPAHALPSQALAELASRYGVAAGAAVLAFDALPGDTRDALTRVVDAFLAVDARARLTYADGRAAPGEIGLMLDVRGPVLRAIGTLSRLVEYIIDEPGPLPSQVSLCPAFSIDLGTENDTNTADCALVIDAGGADVYRNNAGGGYATANQPTSPVAAALVDLGGGADQYGAVTSVRPGGVNGGGSIGSGLLVDGGGSDRYVVAASEGLNGGAYAGTGLLIDAGGADTYAGGAGTAAANGGASTGGAGLLVDTGGGSDSYAGGSVGVNGGGSGGHGTLVDDGGDDSYAGGGNGVNGGGNTGSGFLLDAGQGSDSYTAGAFGSNGAAGGTGGSGLLLDAGGLGDTYIDTEPGCNGSGTDRLLVPKCAGGAQVDMI